MPTVTLTPITRENWGACIQLTVAPEQKTFVASNLYSLAQAKVQPECVPLGIVLDDTMVGFLMYLKETADGCYWVARLMVDSRFQGRGAGRAAMVAIMEELRGRPDFRVLRISYEPDNERAASLYRSLGFRETGAIIEGEVVLELEPPSRDE